MGRMREFGVGKGMGGGFALSGQQPMCVVSPHAQPPFLKTPKLLATDKRIGIG